MKTGVRFMINTIQKRLASLEKPIKVGIAGAGEFSLEMITQISCIKNMEVSAIADIAPETAVKAFRAAGYADDDIVIAASAAQAKSYMDTGKRIVFEDGCDLCGLPLDALCDVTGDPCFGAEFGYKAIENGKHVIVVNIESDVVVGPILRRLADKAGVVYTEGDGDQPSLIKGLYDWADVLGLDVTVAGKWTTIYPEQDQNRGGKRSDIGYYDGSKNQVEMCCVANMTGFIPDITGMHKPSLKLTEIVKTFSLKEHGGILSSGGVIDVVNCLSPDGKTVVEPLLGGGVFIIIRSDNPQVHHAIRCKGFLGSGDAKSALIYRPYHFVGIETPMSILKAVLYNEPTGAVLPDPVADVISIAKKDLNPGEILDGIGGAAVRGVAERYDIAKSKNLLPLGLAEKVRVNRFIPKGTELTYDMLEKGGDTFIWKLRKLQDHLVK
jgi:predicted homoserine dehydrogenase-like protein